MGFDAGQAFKCAFGLKRNVERTCAFAVSIEFVFCFLQGFFQTRQFFADERQAAGGDLNVAFAVLRDVVVGDAVEDGAGFFRINIGVGKVDDGAGFAFADDRELVFDVFDGTELGKLGQLEILLCFGKDLVDFQNGFVIDFQRSADAAFFGCTVRERQDIVFAVFDGQFEGFVDPFFGNGKCTDFQNRIVVAAEVVNHVAENREVGGFDFLVKLKLVNGFSYDHARLDQFDFGFGRRRLVGKHVVDFGQNLVLFGFDFQHGVGAVNGRGRKAENGTEQAARNQCGGDFGFVQPQIVQLLAEIDFVVVGGC